MSILKTTCKDRFARSLAGIVIILLLVIQKYYNLDFSIPLYFVGLNLFQYGLTGWCPFAHWFIKIGWLQKY